MMLIPSTFILVFGMVAVLGLAVIDWFVWGLNLATDPRAARHPKPLTGLELVDLALSRLTATQAAVLPKAAFESEAAHKTPLTTDPGDGFKRVA